MVALPRLLLCLFFLCTVLLAKAAPPHPRPQCVCDTHILEHVLLLIAVTAAALSYEARSTCGVQSHSATKALTERTKFQECAVLYMRAIASYNSQPDNAVGNYERSSFTSEASSLAQWVLEFTDPRMCIFTTKGIPEN